MVQIFPLKGVIMSIRRFIQGLAATSVVAATFAVAPPVQAHVGIYVAGMSGVPVDTTTTNATYLVGFAPGHGCSGPRTAANPDGAYETTLVEVFMPKNSDGKFILPEVRVVHGLGYRATIKSVPDPTNAALKRVNSIVFDQFRLQAVNGTMTARDAQIFTIAVKLPKLADVKTANASLASGTTSSAAAKIYFPTMQYCDVTDQGVGVQAATSTPASVTDTADPTCNANDTIQTTLKDNWTTVSNTPSLTIGTSATDFLEITGNKPTVAATTAEKFCSQPGGFNPRDLPLAGKFYASFSTAKKTLTIRVADSAVNAGRMLSVATPSGTVLGKGRVTGNGVLTLTLKGAKVTGVTKGLSLRLKWGSRVLATDAA